MAMKETHRHKSDDIDLVSIESIRNKDLLSLCKYWTYLIATFIEVFNNMKVFKMKCSFLVGILFVIIIRIFR